MRFTKMQGCGNDYVYVDCTKKDLVNPEELAVKLSDRHFGIGSDGLILIQMSQKADFTMAMYNADGSRSQMCGNGIRCVAKFVYDKGLTDKKDIAIETLAGIKYIHVETEAGKVKRATVNMGKPIVQPELVPVRLPGDSIIARTVNVDGKDYEITCVSMGNPHAVTFMTDIDNLDIETVGPKFEHHEIFPERVNTEFIEVIDRKHIKMRVWERGSGETLACGTGATASVYACILNGFTEDEVTVHLLGGDLDIKYNREDGCLYMTGSAVTVFEGEVEE